MISTANIYRIVLFGHRNFNDFRTLDEYLYPFLKDIIMSKHFTEIYIGRNGEFDIYAATIVKRVQNSIGKANNEFICVLPYIEKDIEYYEKYYDHVMIPECIEQIHPKGAITKRNQWMTEQADLFICYINHKEGGAYSTLKYAKKLQKEIINLAEEPFLNI